MLLSLWYLDGIEIHEELDSEEVNVRTRRKNKAVNVIEKNRALMERLVDRRVYHANLSLVASKATM